MAIKTCLEWAAQVQAHSPGTKRSPASSVDAVERKVSRLVSFQSEFLAKLQL